MKKKDYRRVEAVAQEMLNAPTDESVERMEEVKARAFQIYKMQQEMESAAGQKTVRRYEKRGLRPGMMTALAVALAFLVFPIISAMLFPVQDSIADEDWKRTVIIWLNDTFHTKIRVPESVHDDGGISQLDFGDERVFYDVGEAAEFVGTGLVAIGNDVLKSELLSITVQAIDEDIYRVVGKYRVDDIDVTMTMRSILDRETNAARAETYTVNTRIGEMILWSQEDARYGFAVAGEWIVIISADCSMEEAQQIFTTAYLIN